MKLAGEWNWWAPRPLERLHDRFGISESAPDDEPAQDPTSDPEPVAVGV
jgi:RND superfamily putative drug exporter